MALVRLFCAHHDLETQKTLQDLAPVGQDPVDDRTTDRTDLMVILERLPRAWFLFLESSGNSLPVSLEPFELSLPLPLLLLELCELPLPFPLLFLEVSSCPYWKPWSFR